MQSGQRLKDAYSPSLTREIAKGVGQGLVSMIHQDSDTKKTFDEPKTVSLTPEEQELVKSIDGKASKPAFQVNIRLLASATTKERAEDILAHMENAFSQFSNSSLTIFFVILIPSRP
jgi:hypothetical protein